MRCRPVTGVSSLIGAGLFAGTGGITGRALAEQTGLAGPAVAAYRIGLGGGLIVIVLLLRGVRPPRPGAACRRILHVAVLAAGIQGTFFAAIGVGGVSETTLVTIGSAPVFVLLYTAFRERHRPAAGPALVVLLALTGLLLLVGIPAPGATASATLTCGGLAAVSGGCFAGFTLLGHQPLIGISGPVVTGYGLLIGGALIAIAAAPVTGFGFAVSPYALGLLAALASISTALVYTLFLGGLRTVGAATATVVALLEPLTGTVLAVLLFGERLSGAGAVGAGLLLLAIVASTRAEVTGDPSGRPSTGC